MNTTQIGVDLAKSVFEVAVSHIPGRVHALGAPGRPRRSLPRRSAHLGPRPPAPQRPQHRCRGPREQTRPRLLARLA